MISSHALLAMFVYELRAPRCAWACRGAGTSSFAWHETKLEAVRAVLREDGLSDDDIDAKLYYDVAWFRTRVERIVLPPSALYWRVRAVYELYGNMKDKKTDAPLFGEAAWRKAKNVLKEILAGHCSDPPGMSFYRHKLTKRGELAYDHLGIALLECSRGTNDVEVRSLRS